MIELMNKIRRMQQMHKKILYIDMDNVLVDFPSGISRLPETIVMEYDGRLDEVPGIFSLMQPLPQAVESFEVLAGLFDTYILSTSPWENPSAWSDKLLWVKQHIGQPAYKRLILSHHKNLNAGHYLVDDRTKNGADRFPGEHIHFGTDKFPDWVSVVDYPKSRSN
jgi:5'-nucleotidase